MFGKHTTKRKKRAILLVIAVGLLLMALFAIFLCVALAPYAGATMDMTLLTIPRESMPSVLYAYTPEKRSSRQGELSEAPGCTLTQTQPMVYTPLSDMPKDLINAFVAIEDKRFWNHRGVDLFRTVRASVRYLLGNPSFGGSTITQQLIKNLTGEDDFTPERKLTEIFRALDLERKADKETILEAYLNIINLAGGCRGVGAAAEAYFSKPVSDLTPAECASIAAITNNPTRYNPLTHPEANLERRNLILRRMAEEGYITPEACAEAQNTPLDTHPQARKETAGVTSWYADMVVLDVIRDLMDEKGYTYSAASLLVYGGGLHIETVMDTTLQPIVENYYRDLTHFPEGERGYPASSFILIDPKNGDVLAVAGAAGEKQGNRLQSYATDTRRPAGSCIKPLTVYMPAVIKGLIQWNTPVEDAPITVKNGCPWPSNADGCYRGTVTAAESMAHSLNPAAVTLLEAVGQEYSYRLATQKLGLWGLGGIDEATVSSLALGQQSVGVTLRELTAAYTVFSDGQAKRPRSYHRVLDGEGNVILDRSDPPTSVCTPAQAALMTRLLTEVVERGTVQGKVALTRGLGISVAGKTGTTQHNWDRRFIGYTPRLLGGVWMGYEYPAELTGIQGNPCIRIWDEILSACETSYEGAPCQTEFPTPPELIRAEYCPRSGCCPNPYCTHPAYGMAMETGWFIRGTQPQGICPYHTEPPIVLQPNDTADPDRIPLFPEDLSPDPPARESAPAAPKHKKTSPFRRWFPFF